MLLRGVFSPGIRFYYLRTRYYNPSIGKFISKNPERDKLNWYIYDNNNPVMFTDRTRLPIILRGITNKNMIRFTKMTRDM
ncbi:RHS repeat-associated core domain-containing protein [Flavonifractor hominis]|uniref:RHS repeat-associated core domain-containing protein n=1 Tax=Flavonifractor hominis TaxID=3133178 RepID=UPI00338D7146